MKWRSRHSKSEVPMKKRNIVLIGPMGTGKSRAAKILSDGLEWQLADTDRMMERETGKKIADFYKEAGPEAFAEKEMQVIGHVRYYHEAVIAMGGNYPMTEEKFHLLSEYGLMILLYARPFRLAERVRRRIGKRPTMDYSDVDGYVRQMLRKWAKWRDRVDLVINTTNCHPEQTALLIARYIDQHHISFAERRK
ncbi:shikimate kinase [Dialister sp.]|uniref:shikimate kinase n=1 Tax=Dialister sp. TaxID=1955814 RepID=UPI0025CCAB7F|nr:shikimate kinase [Dialister sp.]MEE0291083.1 shikimate kinase [Dialister sp.]